MKADRRRAFRTVRLVTAVAALSAAACWNPFAPRLTGSLQGSDLILTEQKSPEDVLQNFKVAYAFRDSLLYSDLLDTAFQFVYYDPNEGASGQFVSWGRDVDLRATGRLLRHVQIADLVWKSTLSAASGETDAAISKGFDLTLVADDFDVTLSGRAVFEFRKCRDAKWRIVRWTDDTDN
jgi:hypothetical protein